MLFDYGNVLVFALVGIGFVFTALLLGSVLRPSVPTPEKLSTYECGEMPIGSAWMNFNIRFYVVALIFVVFDVEVAFMFPIARIFKDWIENGKGGVALVEIFIFVAILLLGFVYAWVKGDLDWVKQVARDIKEQQAPASATKTA